MRMAAALVLAPLMLMTILEACCNLAIADVKWILEDNKPNGLVARWTCQ